MNKVNDIKDIKISIELDNEGLVKQKIILNYGKNSIGLKKSRYKKLGFIDEFPEIKRFLEDKGDCLEACLFVRQQEDKFNQNYRI